MHRDTWPCDITNSVGAREAGRRRMATMLSLLAAAALLPAAATASASTAAGTAAAGTPAAAAAATAAGADGRGGSWRRRAQGCPHCSPDCAHSAPHCACPPHCPDGHPVPAPTPRPYESLGSIDIDTYENTIFWWGKKTYVLENIPCTYEDHAGHWPQFAAFSNHSYARIRDFATGVVVANITSTIGFGFVNSFPDYDHNRLWLFGTPADRCHGNCGACSGASCPRGADGKLRPSCTSIQAWWTSLPSPTRFETAVAIPAGTTELAHTYNQGASRVRVPGPGMPHHRYVMISEPFNFFINDDPDGNLTAAGAGWKLAPGQKAPKAAGGGVSMQARRAPFRPPPPDFPQFPSARVLCSRVPRGGRGCPKYGC